MHRAGFTKTRSHPPLQIPAKADNQKRRKPARMVYDVMLPCANYSYLSGLQLLLSLCLFLQVC